MKWVVIGLGAVVAIVVLALVIGALLPRNHVARTATTLRATPEQIWDAITNVAAAPTWRDVQKVEMLSNGSGPLRWREHSKFGPITYEQADAARPVRFVSRIADTDQGFGGTWTYTITPDGAGSRVSITEDGFVSNPLFRFMSRFIFGYYGAQEDYLRALGKKFGETVPVTREN